MMMTDRELLELAAKAANIEYQRTDDGEVIEYFSGGLQLPFDGGKWNPLKDDGDALRLSVKLKLNIMQGDYSVLVDDEAKISESCDFHHGNPLASTRRAIVCAAAEIGKQMP